MNMLPVDKWIANRILFDQTQIVQQFISVVDNIIMVNTNYNLPHKLYNNFLAWSNVSEKIIIDNESLNLFLSSEKEKLDKAKRDIEELINSDVQSGVFRMDESKHLILSRLTQKFEQCKSDYRNKSKNVIFLHNTISWYLLDNENFANLLADFGLPVLTIGKNNWWGFFKSKTKFFKQEIFFSCFGSLKINPFDNISIVVSDLRTFLEIEGYIEQKTYPKENKEPNLSEKLRKFSICHKETRHELEIRKDLSNFSDNHFQINYP